MNKEEEAELKRKMDILWRGMYGDEHNEIPGVVDKVKYLDKIKKAIYVGSGFLAAIQVAIWIIEKFHLI